MKKVFLLMLFVASFSATAQIKIKLNDTVMTNLGNKDSVVLTMDAMSIHYSDSTYKMVVSFKPTVDSVNVEIFTNRVPILLQYKSTTYPTMAAIRREYKKALRAKGRNPKD